MNIISYNVNGIRSAMSKGFLLWLEKLSPDVVCIQETKAQEDQIPALDFKTIGYDCYSFSAKKKGYSGVAIITKLTPKKVTYGMEIKEYDDEGRMIRCDFDDVSVVSVYHPSGTSGQERQDFKMKWLKDFQSYAINIQKEIPNIIFCGDYNICHQAIDIHDPKGNSNHSGFLPEERQWIGDFIDSGFIDSFRFLNPDKKDAYSWWSYRFNSRSKNKGWRIDYCMVSKMMKDRIISADILFDVYHSDHCPISLTIK